MAQPYISDKILWFIKNESKKCKILDIATWQWYLLEILWENWFKNLYSADIDESNFKLDKEKYKFSKLDANETLPFTDNFFDIVVSSETIEHVENPRFFLKEIYRILKKGWIFILSTPNTETIFSKIYFLLTWIFAGHTIADYTLSGHITILTSRLIERFTKDIGFKKEELIFNCFYIPGLKIYLKNFLVNKLFGCISIYKFKK